MRALPVWQNAVVGEVADLLRTNERVRGLWLAGSLARGDADRLSDIDFVVAVDDRDLDETAAIVVAALQRRFDIVLLRGRSFGSFRLLNLVTVDWERLDLSLYRSDDLAVSSLRGLRRVFDLDGVGARLQQPAVSGARASTDQVEYTLTEFARVLGLLPVVLGRGDLVGAIAGSGLLRDHLVALLRYQQVDQPARGALNETAQLTTRGVQTLNHLPPLAPNAASILTYNRACLTAFLDHAPRVAADYGVEWPTRLIDALHARLAREFDGTFEI